MDYSYLNILVLVTTCIVGIVFLIRHLYDKHRNDKVLSHSSKITDLKKLNKSFEFKNINDTIYIKKHYDNKRNFYKVMPIDVLSSEVFNKIESYANYIASIQYNRDKLKTYLDSTKELFDKKYDYNFETIGIPIDEFYKREAQLFNSRVLKPTTNCKIIVSLTYSSPKGKVNEGKQDTFNFEQLLKCYQNISKDRLDYTTYSRIANVVRGEVSNKLRYDILNRDGFKCVICGATRNDGAKLQIDHIIPVSKGGQTTPDNLRTLCERCNMGKSNKIETGFLKQDSIPHDIKSTNDDRCPICGGILIQKNGKYGAFYGCQNYPQCRYTRNI